MQKIKEIVTEEEIKKLDRVIEEIYSIDYGSNQSVAFQWGFNTVSNLNGRGYENLVIIIDKLNDGGEDENFSRFILGKVLNDKKIKMLKKELSENRNRYSKILYL